MDVKQLSSSFMYLVLQVVKSYWSSEGNQTSVNPGCQRRVKQLCNCTVGGRVISRPKRLRSGGRGPGLMEKELGNT